MKRVDKFTSPTSVRNKNRIRSKLITSVLSLPQEYVKLLTLPSAYWTFEHALGYESTHKEYEVIGCEINTKVFNRAKYTIPQATKDPTIRPHYRLGCDTVNVANHQLLNIDIYEYMMKAEQRFDFIWLDTMNTISTIISKSIDFKSITTHNSIVAISFINGRDKLIKNGVGEAKLISMLETQGFTLIDNEKYYDTSSMIHLTFKRN